MFTVEELNVIKVLINGECFDGCQYKINGVWLHDLKKKINSILAQG